MIQQHKLISATVLAAVIIMNAGLLAARQAPVRASLVSDSDQVALGEEFRVGLKLEIEKGWHIYWTYPGNTGRPTKVRFSSNHDHTKVLQPSFPYPKVFDASDIDDLSFGYEHEVLITAKAMVFDAPAEAHTTIRVHVTYLACKNSCVTGSADPKLTIALGKTRKPSSMAAEFDATENHIPKTLGAKDAYLESFFFHDGHYSLQIALPTIHSAKGFVPSWIQATTCKIDKYNIIQTQGEPVRVQLQLHGYSCLPGAGGVLLATGSDSAKGDDKAIPVHIGAWAKQETHHLPEMNKTPVMQTASKATPENGSGGQGSLWLMLLFAFLGGMILNVMPCVIPVVIPKLLHVVRTAQKTSDAGTRRKLLWSNALAYSAGVLSTLLALATLVVVLKHLGHEVGWGFQFQNPWFLIFMISLLVVLGLGMLHVFPLQSSSHSDDLKHLRKTRRRSPLLESFLTGLLVTFLGTPCTAPMLGPALGYAFTAGDLEVFVLLASVGLGLSFPFLMLGAWTGWAKILPKKVTERYDRVMRGMAFLLFGTAVWLLGVLSSYGAQAVASTLWFCLVLSAAAWLFGLLTSESEPWSKRLVKLVPLVLLIAAAAWWLLEIPSDVQQAQQPQLRSRVGIGWQAFDENKLAELRKAGKTVFVDFTAQWCMNCKANEKLVIETDKTKAIIDRLKIVPLKADNTRRDPLIQKWLKRYHRAGVPMYLVFPSCSEEDKTILLPEILTPSILNDALEKAGSSKISCTTKL